MADQILDDIDVESTTTIGQFYIGDLPSDLHFKATYFEVKDNKLYMQGSIGDKSLVSGNKNNMVQVVCND